MRAANRDGTLRLLTYNVLDDPLPVAAVRVPALLALLAGADADVIALQEVQPWFLEALSRESWLGGYARSHEDVRVAPPGGALVLSRLPIAAVEAHALPGEQGRAVVVATLELGVTRLAVATAHLESPLQAGAHRAAQLDTIFERLAPRPHAVLMGDLNFGDGAAPESSRLCSSFVDAWSALRPTEPGFTWDIERSPMAARAAYQGEPSRRLDRILVRLPDHAPRAVHIVGDTPVDGGEVFPSDHFGVRAVLAAPP